MSICFSWSAIVLTSSFINYEIDWCILLQLDAVFQQQSQENVEGDQDQFRSFQIGYRQLFFDHLHQLGRVQCIMYFLSKLEKIIKTNVWKINGKKTKLIDEEKNTFKCCLLMLALERTSSINWVAASFTDMNRGGEYDFIFFVKLSGVGSFTWISVQKNNFWIIRCFGR